MQRYAGWSGALGPARSAWARVPSVEFPNLLAAGLNSDLARWLASALPYVVRRLRLALNLPQTTDADLSETLFFHSGTLHVTSSHIDLVMPLAESSVLIRRAGLDQDPGWLPDFGRVIQFHFE